MKKALGILFLIVAVLLAVTFVLMLPELLVKLTRNSEGFAYALGYIFPSVLQLVLVVVFWKLGRAQIKK